MMAGAIASGGRTLLSANSETSRVGPQFVLVVTLLTMDLTASRTLATRTVVPTAVLIPMMLPRTSAMRIAKSRTAVEVTVSGGRVLRCASTATNHAVPQFVVMEPVLTRALTRNLILVTLVMKVTSTMLPLTS